MVDSIWQDLKYAARSMRRTPLFTAAAVVTLALGIGATTAIFSLIDALLLRTLPVAAPQELYFVAHGAGTDLSRSSNYRWFERVQRRSDVFAGTTAYTHRTFKIASDAGVERVAGQFVSGNYHALLGTPMALGRGFVSESDRTPGASAIAVISHDYWGRRFGRSPAVLNESLVIGGHRVSIVGVTAAGFAGLAPGDAIDVTLPLSMRLLDEPDFLSWTDTWTSMPVVARLKRGVGFATAAQAVASSYREYMQEPFNADFRTENGLPRTATLVAAARGDDDLRNEYEMALQVLAGMVGLVLLIVCVNVASLLVVRASTRARDVAIRMAVGASRLKLLRPFIAESLMLAFAGGSLGFLLAAWALEFISLLLRSGLEPIVVDVQPNRTVLLFSMAVSAAVGLAFGLGPAFAATRVDPTPALRGAVGTVARRRWQARDVLVAAQVALCLVLVFGAGLLVRTLQNLRGLDGGFEKTGVIVLSLDARDTRLPRERLAPLCADVIAALRKRADVLSGSCSTMSPIDTSSEQRALTFDGMPKAERPPAIYANSVDADYFATLGLRVVRGRGLFAGDRAASTAVAVLSETAARRHFGDADPVGRTFRWGWRQLSAPITIVGVVEDARLALRDAPPEMIYTPLDQRAEPSPDLLAAVRTRDAPPAFIRTVREQVRAASPDVALTYVRSMDEQIDAALVSERLLAMLSAAFGLLALVLACVGLYGVMAHDVSRRTREIGIRLALGASRAEVLSTVGRHTGAIVAIGLAAGLVAAAIASRVVTQLLFGLESSDPSTLIGAVAVLTVTAMLAGYFPARRASRIDPIRALRTE
jgi:putative ABC transport system permease protein